MAQGVQAVHSCLRVVVDVLEAVQVLVDVVGPAVCGQLYFLRRGFFAVAVVVRGFVSAWKMLVVACFKKGPGLYVVHCGRWWCGWVLLKVNGVVVLFVECVVLCLCCVGLGLLTMYVWLWGVADWENEQKQH